MPPLTSGAPFVDCTELLASPERLRAAARERGYLFFRGLLPAADVIQVRRAVLQGAAAHGTLAAGTAVEAGIAREGVGASKRSQYVPLGN